MMANTRKEELPVEKIQNIKDQPQNEPGNNVTPIVKLDNSLGSFPPLLVTIDRPSVLTPLSRSKIPRLKPKHIFPANPDPIASYADPVKLNDEGHIRKPKWGSFPSVLSKSEDRDQKTFVSTRAKRKIYSSSETLKTHGGSLKAKLRRSTAALSKPEFTFRSVAVIKQNPRDMTLTLTLRKSMGNAGLFQNKPGVTECKSTQETRYLTSSEARKNSDEKTNAHKLAMNLTCNADIAASYADVLRVNNDSMEVPAGNENVSVVSDEGTWELQHKFEDIPRKYKDLDPKYVVQKEDSRGMDSECSPGEPKSNADLLKLSTTSPEFQPGCKRISPGSGGSHVLDQKCENHNVETRGIDLNPSPDKPVSCADPLRLNSEGRKCKPKWGHFSSVLSQYEKSSQKIFMPTPNKRKIDSSCETAKSKVDSQKLNQLPRQFSTKLGRYTSGFSTPEHSIKSIGEPKLNQIKPLMSLLFKPVSHASPLEFDSEAMEVKRTGTHLPSPRKAEELNENQETNADKWTMDPTCNPDKLANYADVLTLNVAKQMLPDCKHIPADSGECKHRDQNLESEEVCSRYNLGKPSSCAGELEFSNNFREPQPNNEQIHLGSSGMNDMGHTYNDADKWVMDPPYISDKLGRYADVLKVNNDSMEVQPEYESVAVVSNNSKQGHQKMKGRNARPINMNLFCDFDAPMHYVSRLRQKTWESQHESENIPRKNRDLDPKYVVHKEDSRDMDSECSPSKPKSNADLLKLSTTPPKLQPGCKGIFQGTGGSRVLDQNCENHNAESQGMDLKPSPDKSVSCADPLKLNSEGRKSKPKWGQFSSVLSKSEKSSEKMFVATKRKIYSSCETIKSNVDSKKLNPRARQLNTKFGHYTSVFSTPGRSNRSNVEPKSNQIKPLMSVLVKPLSHACPINLDHETTAFKPRGTHLPLPSKAEEENEKQKINADEWPMVSKCNPDKLANHVDVLKLSDSKEMLPECKNVPADSGESKHRDQNCEAHNSESEDVCSGCSLDKPSSCAGELRFSNNVREPQSEYEQIHIGSSKVNSMDHTCADADKWVMDRTSNPDIPASYADVLRMINDPMEVQVECKNIPVVSDVSKHGYLNCKTHNAKSMKMNSFCDFNIPLHCISRLGQKTWEVQHVYENIPRKYKDVDLKHVVHKEDFRDMDSESGGGKPKSHADLLKLSTTSPKLQPGCKRISPGTDGSRVLDQKCENHNAETRGMDLKPSPDKPVSCADPLKLNSDGRKCKPKWGHFSSVLSKSEKSSQKMLISTPTKQNINLSSETTTSNVDSQKLNPRARQLNTKSVHYTSVFSTPERSHRSITKPKINQIKPLMSVLVKPLSHACPIKLDHETTTFKSIGTRLPLPSKAEEENEKQKINADEWPMVSKCNPDKLANHADVLKLSDSKEMLPECENIPADFMESKHMDQNCEAHNSESEDVCSGCDLSKPLSCAGELEFSINLRKPKPEYELIHLGSSGMNDMAHTCADADKWEMDPTYNLDKAAHYADVVRVNNDSMEVQLECDNVPVVSDESKQGHQNCQTHNAKSMTMDSFWDFNKPLHYVSRMRHKTCEKQNKCENIPRKNKDLDLKYEVHKEGASDVHSECSAEEPKSNADLVKLSTTSPKFKPEWKWISQDSLDNRVLNQKCENHNAEARGMDLKPSLDKPVSCADPLKLNSDGRKCKPKWGYFPSVLSKSEKSSQKVFVTAPNKRKLYSSYATIKSNVDSQKLNPRTRQLNTKLGNYASVVGIPEHSNKSIGEPRSKQIKPLMSVLVKSMSRDIPLQLDFEATEFKPRGTGLLLASKAEKGKKKQRANADKWATDPACNPDKLANDVNVLKLSDSKEMLPECENIPADSEESTRRDKNYEVHNLESEDVCSGCNLDKPSSCAGELEFSNNFWEPPPECEQIHLGSSEVDGIGHTYADADKCAVDPTYNPDKAASYADVSVVNNDSMEVQPECENVPVVLDETRQMHQNAQSQNATSMKADSFCDFDLPLRRVSRLGQKTLELQHEFENIPGKSRDLDLEYIVHSEDSRDMDSEYSSSEPKSNADWLKLSTTSPELQPGCKRNSPGSGGSRVLDQKCENHNAESQGLDMEPSPDKPVSCADPLRLNSDGRKCKPKWGHFASVLSKSEKWSQKMLIATPSKRKIGSSCETTKCNVYSQKLNPHNMQLNTKFGLYTSVFSTPEHSNKSFAEHKSKQMKPFTCVLGKPKSHAWSLKLDSETTEFQSKGTLYPLPRKAEKAHKKYKAKADTLAMDPTCNHEELANDIADLKLGDSKEMLPEYGNIPADSGESKHRDRNCEADNSASVDACSCCNLDKPLSCVDELNFSINFREPQPEYELLNLGSSGVNDMGHTFADADKWFMNPTYSPDKPTRYADVVKLNNDSMEVQPDCENVSVISDESKKEHENCKTNIPKLLKMDSLCDFDTPLHYVSRLRQKTPGLQHECENIPLENKDLDLKYVVHKEDSSDMDSECSAEEPKSNADRLNLRTTSPKLQLGSERIYHKSTSYADVVKLNNYFSDMLPECEATTSRSWEIDHWDQNCEARSAESSEKDPGCEASNRMTRARLLTLNTGMRELLSEGEPIALGSSGVNDIDHTYASADKWAVDATYNPEKPASYTDVVKLNNNSRDVQPDCENVSVISDESKKEHQNCKTNIPKLLKMDSLCDFDTPLHYVSRLRQKTPELQHECENIPLENEDLDLKFVVHKEDSSDIDSECSAEEPKSNADRLNLSATSPKLQPGCERIYHKSTSYADVVKLNNDSRDVQPDCENVSVISDETKQDHENWKTNNAKLLKLDSLCDFDIPLHCVSRLGQKTPELQHESENIPRKNRDLDLKNLVYKEDSRDMDSECGAGDPKRNADLLKLSTTYLKLQQGFKRIYHKPTSYADVVKLNNDFMDMQLECENIHTCSRETEHWDLNCEAQSAESDETVSGCETAKRIGYARLLNTRMLESQSELERVPLGSSEVNGTDHLYADSDVHGYKMNAAASILAKSTSSYNQLQINPTTEEYVATCTSTYQNTALSTAVYMEHPPPTFWSPTLNADIPHDNTGIDDREIQDVEPSLPMLLFSGRPSSLDHLADTDDDGPKIPELWRSISPWSWSNLPPFRKLQLGVPKVLGCLKEDEGVSNPAVETQQDDAEKGAVGLLAISDLLLEAPKLEMNVDEFTKMVGDTFRKGGC